MSEYLVKGEAKGMGSPTCVGAVSQEHRQSGSAAWSNNLLQPEDEFFHVASAKITSTGAVEAAEWARR
jgi:hypothetical protein